VIALVALPVALVGCATIEETGREPEGPPGGSPGRTFETRTDTVDAVEGPRSAAEGNTSLAAGTGFAVQIGAFRDPRNASAAQTAARSRFQIPVTNEYNALAGLYFIRAGFFHSRKEAVRFRETIVSRFPADYADSWIVEVNRNP
jgi:cell division septation protein DedD